MLLAKNSSNLTNCIDKPTFHTCTLFGKYAVGMAFWD